MNNNNFKVLLVGTGGYSNRGCEAIVRGTIEIISQHFPNADFILSPFGKNLEEDKKNEIDDRISRRIPVPFQRFC